MYDDTVMRRCGDAATTARALNFQLDLQLAWMQHSPYLASRWGHSLGHRWACGRATDELAGSYDMMESFFS